MNALVSSFVISVLFFFFLLLLLLLSLSFILLVTKNQPNSHTIHRHIDMPVVFRTNGYWAEMRLPFSLTKYMRFSVLFVSLFSSFLLFPSLFYSINLIRSLVRVFFSNIYFHLVRCSCCPPTHADVLLYVLYVRAILLRVVLCTFFYCVPFLSDTVLFLRFTCDHFSLRSSTLSLVAFTFIIEFSAHMRGGSECVHRFSKQQPSNQLTTNQPTLKVIHWQTQNVDKIKHQHQW